MPHQKAQTVRTALCPLCRFPSTEAYDINTSFLGEETAVILVCALRCTSPLFLTMFPAPSSNAEATTKQILTVSVTVPIIKALALCESSYYTLVFGDSILRR